MGNSISMVCCPYELARERGEVLVIKEDGEALRFKDGTLVKDILSSYPYHNIIRCCSQRTIIPVETQLSCNWLYFLLPMGLALSEAAYQNLVRSATSQNLIAKRATTEDNGLQGKKDIIRRDDKAKGGTSNGYCATYKWKPILRTIPEIASPSA